VDIITDRLRDLDCGFDDAALDAAIEINELYGSKETHGGVYMLQISDVRFKMNDESRDDLVLVKIGRTDNYKKRFRQLYFPYTVVFRYNGDNLFEKRLKQSAKTNRFYHACYGKTKVASIKQYLGIIKSANPGFTEWFIMYRTDVDALRQMAETDRFDVSMANHCFTMQLEEEIPVGELTIMFSAPSYKPYERANTKTLQLHKLQDQ
jgi:hypothetical protein